MADELSMVLFGLVEYFNYLAVILIVFGSVAMIIFIVRLNGEHLGIQYTGHGASTSSLAYHKTMAEFCNPFFLRLTSPNLSCLSDGLDLELSCLVTCELAIFWGAAVNPTQQALLQNGITFLEDLHCNQVLEGHCLVSEKHKVEKTGKHKLHLSVPPEVNPELLGCTPRQRYPCVIVMATVLDSSSVIEANVVATVTVIHLKDALVQMETHIIAQYAKMTNEAVYSLQPLFFASYSDTESSGTEVNTSLVHTQSSNQVPTTSSSCELDSTLEQADIETRHRANPTILEDSSCRNTMVNSRWCHEERETVTGLLSSSTERSHMNAPEHLLTDTSGSRDLLSLAHRTYINNLNTPENLVSVGSFNKLPDCIVCQNRQLSCVLLPCRHACVCHSCFRLLDKCPMCRSHVETYFTLTDNDESIDDSHEVVAVDWMTKFEIFNQRLNDFFGFS